MKYIEVNNDELGKVFDSLPINYKNISNFYALTDEQLKDLSWSGNNLKLYRFIEQGLPETFSPFNKISDPEYIIDHDNGIVYANYTIEIVDPVDIPDSVPNSITATQIRLWLIENNFSLSDIDNLIQSIEDQKTREKVMTEWEYAPYILRNHPFISVIGSALGLDDNQIDQAFIEASKIGENL